MQSQYSIDSQVDLELVALSVARSLYSGAPCWRVAAGLTVGSKIVVLLQMTGTVSLSYQTPHSLWVGVERQQRHQALKVMLSCSEGNVIMF